MNNYWGKLLMTILVSCMAVLFKVLAESVTNDKEATT